MPVDVLGDLHKQGSGRELPFIAHRDVRLISATGVVDAVLDRLTGQFVLLAARDQCVPERVEAQAAMFVLAASERQGATTGSP